MAMLHFKQVMSCFFMHDFSDFVVVLLRMHGCIELQTNLVQMRPSQKYFSDFCAIRCFCASLIY